MTKTKTPIPEPTTAAPVTTVYRNAPSIQDERVESLQTASAQYRHRVQAESALERAKPAAPYAVGRAALDEAMRVLGAARFHAPTEAQSGAAS